MEARNKNKSKLQKKIDKKLRGSQFRILNEKLYKSTSQSAFKFFNKNPQEFSTYHKGYNEQISKWPSNPLNKILKYLLSKKEPLKIGDFGCGSAALKTKYFQILNKNNKNNQNLAKLGKNDQKLTKFIKNDEKLLKNAHEFYCYDLISQNDDVIACDIANLPLKSNYLDIGIFSLSLMGTNFLDFIKEAIRVVKIGGEILIIEVKSRFLNKKKFIKTCYSMGLDLIDQDDKNKMFLTLILKKSSRKPVYKNLPKSLSLLKPCLYKQR